MNEKSVLRKQIKDIIRTLPLSYKIKAGEVISEKVISSPEFINAQSIFIYLSTPDEPETRHIIKKALETGKRVYVPLCISKGVMKKVRITKNTLFVKGYMGIKEPAETADDSEEEVSLAIIPCLSASPDGNRLGHGGGFYDRFLENSTCIKFCLCFERLLSDTIPTEKYDIKMDNVISE